MADKPTTVPLDTSGNKFDGLALTADASDVTSISVPLHASDGATAHIKLLNGATGPTLPAEVQVQVSPDDSLWISNGGPLKGGVTNNGAYTWPMDITTGAKFARFVVGSNTDEDVSVSVTVTEWM